MKALRASAGTSQPVLTSQQVQTVFYQVPEIRDIHQSFYSGLKARLSSHCLAESCSGGKEDAKQSGFSLMVGDLFLKMVSSLFLNFPLWHESHDGKNTYIIFYNLWLHLFFHKQAGFNRGPYIYINPHLPF